jgi:hypothetical protein
MAQKMDEAMALVSVLQHHVLKRRDSANGRQD